jgi:[ribosomal protein S18]-alanine N-acetyltransferase
MSDIIFVRDYSQGDFKEINQLWKDTGMGGSARGDQEETIELTLRSGGRLFILENCLTKEIIGTSWLTHDQRRIYMHHFGIKPEYQGKGFARMLLKSSIDFAKKSGMQIKLEVHRDNLKAIQMYKKSGFNYLGDYKVYIIRDYNAIQESL